MAAATQPATSPREAACALAVWEANRSGATRYVVQSRSGIHTTDDAGLGMRFSGATVLETVEPASRTCTTCGKDDGHPTKDGLCLACRDEKAKAVLAGILASTDEIERHDRHRDHRRGCPCGAARVELVAATLTWQVYRCDCGTYEVRDVGDTQSFRRERAS